MNSENIHEIRLYLLRYDRGARAHSKLVRQLKTLRARISEGIPRWQEAMLDHSDTTSRRVRETTALRLDFECYIEILSRFFRLCRDATGIPAIWEEPIVQQIRRVRNRIIEHGYEVNREGDRNFHCDEDGPKLVSDTGETSCPSFVELNRAIAPIIHKYGLTEDGFQGRQMAVRGSNYGLMKMIGFYHRGPEWGPDHKR